MAELQFYLKHDGIRTSTDFGALNISSDEEQGFRPFQLMVSSIAGCSLSVFRKILDKQRVEYEDINVKAEVTRNEDEANRIEKIHLHYVIKGKHLDEDKMFKNLETSQKNCSMVQSVKDSIEIEETLECIELSF
ncbi:OsmC family peroxiredoxin [Pontibacillus yanchengensis]|uniref:OsmC family peroxiredoxin n=2 Tax=Pontibacillus yanchengensis TaxID=462910 RepID=A0ACC7VJ26_9BACI|nr:OsmC family protein [Pontibacillus yanchengensis]MYL34859.1 OsmC family peroxiredoxin [Pontibacillus yanchengensis]MYL54767.1 OsmC family peroxiredoxin [Pontibacillus yanchengensis]